MNFPLEIGGGTETEWEKDGGCSEVGIEIRIWIIWRGVLKSWGNGRKSKERETPRNTITLRWEEVQKELAEGLVEYGRPTPKMAYNDPHLLVFVHTHVVLSPCVWAGDLLLTKSSDLLLTKRIQHKWQDVTSVIRLQKNCDFHLASRLCLVGFSKTSCHVGEAHESKNRGQPPANSQQEMRHSVQQPSRNWILPTTMWMNFKQSLSQWNLDGVLKETVGQYGNCNLWETLK